MSGIDVESDGFFAVIPEWILYGASGNAVKLYGILARKADNATRSSFRSRATLAKDLGYKDAKTVDPFIKELVDMGALRVTPRVSDKGERLSSIYTVITAKSVSDPYPRGTDNVPPKNGQGVAPKTGEELKASLNSEPSNSEPAADKPPAPADLIAKRAYDNTNGALKYQAVRGVAKWALERKGAAPRAIEQAIRGLYELGKPVTNATLGQFLDGHIKPAPSPRAQAEIAPQYGWAN